VDRQRVLVVRCHTCQHLSEELLQKLCRHAVQAAVMPCCQKDRSPVATWKDTAQSLRFSVEMMMDLQLAGRAMSWNVDISYGAVYDGHMKVIKKMITPQNRFILCRTKPATDASSMGLWFTVNLHCKCVPAWICYNSTAPKKASRAAIRLTTYINATTQSPVVVALVFSLENIALRVIARMGDFGQP
jgi:hypothetical protein